MSAYRDWGGDELTVEKSGVLLLMGIHPGHLIEIPPRELLKMALAANDITVADIEAAMDRDIFSCPSTQEHADAVWDRLFPDDGDDQ